MTAALEPAAEFVSEVRRITDLLRELDKRLVVFGAARHRYEFGPRLPGDLLDIFEEQHGVALPPPYRAYLSALGNGGPGPYFGVTHLNQKVPHLARPFAHTEPFDVAGPALDHPLDGAVEIGEFGSGIFVLLVVNGEAAGQVWMDARFEKGVMPVVRDGARATFDRWWLSGMSKHLELFEGVFAMMSEGADHAAIHEALEPEHSQLHVDEAMLSIMDVDPTGRPTGTPAIALGKPWAAACALADEHYQRWLARA